MYRWCTGFRKRLSGHRWRRHPESTVRWKISIHQIILKWTHWVSNSFKSTCEFLPIRCNRRAGRTCSPMEWASTVRKSGQSNRPWSEQRWRGQCHERFAIPLRRTRLLRGTSPNNRLRWIRPLKHHFIWIDFYFELMNWVITYANFKRQNVSTWILLLNLN